MVVDRPGHFRRRLAQASSSASAISSQTTGGLTPARLGSRFGAMSATATVTSMSPIRAGWVPSRPSSRRLTTTTPAVHRRGDRASAVRRSDGSQICRRVARPMPGWRAACPAFGRARPLPRRRAARAPSCRSGSLAGTPLEADAPRTAGSEGRISPRRRPSYLAPSGLTRASTLRDNFRARPGHHRARPRYESRFEAGAFPDEGIER